MGCTLSRQARVVNLSSIVTKKHQPLISVKSNAHRKSHSCSQSLVTLQTIQEDPIENELSVVSL